MKSKQKGFIFPLILAIVTVLVINGIYIYKSKKTETSILPVNNIVVQSGNQTQQNEPIGRQNGNEAGIKANMAGIRIGAEKFMIIIRAIF